MKSIPAAVLATGLAAGNVALGYYAAPLEILFTPAVVVAVVLLLLPYHPRLPALPGRVLLAAVLICGHDAGIKLYGGGTHDLEGQGFIHAFLFMGLLPAYGIVLARVLRQPGRAGLRLAAALVFPAVLAAHLAVFGWLGVE